MKEREREREEKIFIQEAVAEVYCEIKWWWGVFVDLIIGWANQFRISLSANLSIHLMVGPSNA